MLEGAGTWHTGGTGNKQLPTSEDSGDVSQGLPSIARARATGLSKES